ncbi:MAG: hypothetical protein V7719_00230 [Psychroserpens sp.]|uniref:hypothetical protein n=1 Tax=Psychroserpens sp. TaxID=2020870 RepID=UPI0030037FB7
MVIIKTFEAMKTIKKMVFVAIMLTIVSGYADVIRENASVNLMTNVEFSDVKEGHQFIIKDHHGYVLHREVIERNGAVFRSVLYRMGWREIKTAHYSMNLLSDYFILNKLHRSLFLTIKR